MTYVAADIYIVMHVMVWAYNLVFSNCDMCTGPLWQHSSSTRTCVCIYLTLSSWMYCWMQSCNVAVKAYASLLLTVAMLKGAGSRVSGTTALKVLQQGHACQERYYDKLVMCKMDPAIIWAKHDIYCILFTHADISASIRMVWVCMPLQLNIFTTICLPKCVASYSQDSSWYQSITVKDNLCKAAATTVRMYSEPPSPHNT